MSTAKHVPETAHGLDGNAARETLSHVGTFEQLIRRESNGIAVALLWRRANDRVKSDTTTETTFEFDVADASPMDVFHHPYAYAAFRGLNVESAAELAAV